MIAIKISALLLALTPAASTALAGIGMGHHVNIITLQKQEGSTVMPDYPAAISGSMAEMIASMKSSAEPFVTLHSPHIHSGDMVSIQADVLGQGDGSKLEDDGLNCQLSYAMESDTEFTVGGMCTLHTATHEGGKKRNIIVKPVSIKTVAGKQSDWVLLLNDRQSGLGIYASIEP